MGAAIIEVFEVLATRITFFARILRAMDFFVNAGSKIRTKTILENKHIKELILRRANNKRFINYLRDLLFSKLETHKFIFFSEEELRRYVLTIDTNAKILKLADFEEVSLYIVEFSDIQLFLNQQKEDIFLKTSTLKNIVLMFIFFTTFLVSVKQEIYNATKDIENYLVYLTDSDKNDNDLFDFLNDLDLKLKKEVDTIINQRKAEDIANTYCMQCCCGCSCDKGSCSCCCSCSLVHYTQSWENARSDLKNMVDNAINQIKNRIYNDYLNDNNQNSLFHYIHKRLYDKNQNSLRDFFITALASLLFNLRHKQKAKLLFAVIKQKAILEKIKKEKKEKEKGKKIRFAYEFFKRFRYQKVEAKKLKKLFIKEYEKRFKKKCSENLFYAYLSKIDKNYIKIKKLKINDKEYYLIL